MQNQVKSSEKVQYSTKIDSEIEWKLVILAQSSFELNE